MLRPVTMRRLSVIVPKEQMHNLLSYAGHDQNLHLVDSPCEGLPEGANRYESASLLARSAALRNRVGVLSSTIRTADSAGEKLDPPLSSPEELANYLDKETARLEQSLRQHEDSVGKFEGEHEKTQELSRFLTGLEKAGVSLDALGGKGFVTMLAGEVPRESIQAVQRALDGVTYGNVIFAITGSLDKSQTFLAVFPSAFHEEARQTATSLGSKLEPSWVDLPTSPTEAKRTIEQRLQELDESRKRLDQEWDIFTREFGPRIKTMATLSELLEVRTRAVSGSTITEGTFMFQAWVPEDRVQQFIEGASKACHGMASVHSEEATKSHTTSNAETSGSLSSHDKDHASVSVNAPSLVRVPSWGRPLQSVIDNFGIPSYNEINPFIFMLFSYPIIYGLMFGDFGQGPIFILVGFILLRMRKKGKLSDFVALFANGAELFILLGIGTTVFGLVFGDFFGFEHVLPVGPIFSPTEDQTHLQEFLIITLFIGVAHYTFGLLVNTANKFHNKEYREAFFGPVCWVWFYLAGVFEISKVVLANFKFGILLKDPISLAATILPLILMGYGEGGLHAFEAFLSAPSNTFSYLRIWALNIADFYFKSALFIAMGIFGAILGNVLVMIIEALIVFVQTLRLHWIEWFSKFYEGAGVSFAPYTEPKGWNVGSRWSNQ